MDKVITYILIGIFSIMVIYFFMGVLQSMEEPTVVLENLTFASNNTLINLAHYPTDSNLILYYFSNTTFAIPVSLYSATTSQIKVLANCSAYCGTYPNVTNSSSTFYYASYSYQNTVTIWDVNYTFMTMIVFFGMLGAVVLSIIHKNKK